MHPNLLLTSLSLLLPLTAAQTTTSSTTSTPTTLPALLAVLPHCALGCLATAATSIDCAATDFSCLCSNSSDLVSKIGPCIISGSGCSPSDISQLRKYAPSLCSIVSADKNSTDVSAASALVSSALATATSDGKSTQTGTAASSGNGAVVRRPGAEVAGAMGMAGVVVAAMLGL